MRTIPMSFIEVFPLEVLHFEFGCWRVVDARTRPELNSAPVQSGTGTGTRLCYRDRYQALSPVPEPIPGSVKWEYDHNFCISKIAASNKSKFQVLSPIHIGNYKLNENE